MSSTKYGAMVVKPEIERQSRPIGGCSADDKDLLRDIVNNYSRLLTRIHEEKHSQRREINREEIWLIGTHVPPRFKQPVEEPDVQPRSIDQSTTTTIGMRNKIKLYAELILIFVTSYDSTDFLVFVLFRS